MYFFLFTSLVIEMLHDVMLRYQVVITMHLGTLSSPLFLLDYFLFSLRLRLTMVLFTGLVKNHNSYQTAVLFVIDREDKKHILLLKHNFIFLSTSIKLIESFCFSKRWRLMD